MVAQPARVAAAVARCMPSRNYPPKIIAGMVWALLISIFLVFDLHHWLNFETLKRHHAHLIALKTQAPWLVAGGFFVFYVGVTALSLPGATLMALAGGALFGWTAGTVLISFASTIGATCAFLSARYLLRDTVQQRFNAQLMALNKSVVQEGAFYLFTLRLVPLFPFFLINLLMGLTPMRTATFYWVSQVGMLPGTLVYVNAGTQLGQLETPAEIFAPTLLFSFALLGLLPLIARYLVRRLQQRRGEARL